MATGDSFIDGVVNNIAFLRHGFEGNQVGFQVTYTGGAQGVYVATFSVPEPTTLAGSS